MAVTITIYVKGREEPIRHIVHELLGDYPTGTPAYLRFKDEQGEEGRIYINAHEATAVFFDPA